MPEETTTTTTTTTPAEPELIAGKFKDTAAFQQAFTELAKHEKVNMPWLQAAKFDDVQQQVEAYKGMESRLKQPNTPAPDASKLELGGQQQQQAEPPKPMTMQDLIGGLGIEQDKLNQAVQTGGKVPDDIYSKFGQAKIVMPDGTTRPLGKELVDQVLGSQAQGARYQQVLMDQAAAHVGGKEQLNNLIAFGGTLPASTQQSINIELADPTTMKSGLSRLDALYKQSIGAGGSNGIVSQTQGSAGDVSKQPFKTHAEIIAFRKEHGQDSDIYKSRLIATPNEVLNRIA